MNIGFNLLIRRFIFYFCIIILEKRENSFELYMKKKVIWHRKSVSHSSQFARCTSEFVESFIQRLYSLDHFYRRIKVNKVRSFVAIDKSVWIYILQVIRLRWDWDRNFSSTENIYLKNLKKNLHTRVFLKNSSTRLDLEAFKRKKTSWNLSFSTYVRILYRRVIRGEMSLVWNFLETKNLLCYSIPTTNIDLFVHFSFFILIN